MTMTTNPRIALLAAPETAPSVLFGLYDVFIAVGTVYRDMVGGAVGEPLLDIRIVAADAQPFRCFGNILIEPHAAIGDLDHVDAAVVCDMYTPIDTAPPMLAGEANRRDDVRHRLAATDRQRVTIDHAVPDRSGGVAAVVPWREQITRQPGPEGRESFDHVHRAPSVSGQVAASRGNSMRSTLPSPGAALRVTFDV